MLTPVFGKVSEEDRMRLGQQLYFTLKGLVDDRELKQIDKGQRVRYDLVNGHANGRATVVDGPRTSDLPRKMGRPPGLKTRSRNGYADDRSAARKHLIRFMRFFIDEFEALED